MTERLVPFLDAPYEIQIESREWRNSSNVTQYFKIQHIDKSTHIKWIESMKKDNPQTVAFFIQSNGCFIGITYFHSLNYANHTADWGIYIYKPEYLGHGIGRFALSTCIDYAKDKLKLKQIFLDVKDTNVRAKSLYEHMGFVPTGEKDGEFIRYIKEL